MIKFVDMTPTLRAADPQASPACAFLNTETGRFCEHGGTGEHLFTSADDITRHGPPARVGVPLGFFGRPALGLDRVLGRHDEEGLGQRAGHAVAGDAAIGHGLEQGGLGLGRGAVDLVGQQQLGEDRAGHELELLFLLIENVAAALRWADVPIRSLVLCVDDNDIAFKHADGGLEWVRIGGHGIDSEPGQWWPAQSSAFNSVVASECGIGWAVIATGLRGDETVAELQALAGVSS